MLLITSFNSSQIR